MSKKYFFITSVLVLIVSCVMIYFKSTERTISTIVNTNFTIIGYVWIDQSRLFYMNDNSEFFLVQVTTRKISNITSAYTRYEEHGYTSKLNKDELLMFNLVESKLQELNKINSISLKWKKHFLHNSPPPRKITLSLPTVLNLKEVYDCPNSDEILWEFESKKPTSVWVNLLFEFLHQKPVRSYFISRANGKEFHEILSCKVHKNKYSSVVDLYSSPFNYPNNAQLSPDGQYLTFCDGNSLKLVKCR